MKISTWDVVNNVLGGWTYGLYFLPLIIAQYSIIPETWSGNITSAVLFTVLMVILFLIWPRLIGRQYKAEGFEKVRSVILNSIKR